MPDITSSNAVFMLSVPLVFPVPQQLQGFSTDDAFDTDSVEPGETKMGVDGIFSAGVVPVQYPMAIALQADSASAFLFEAWNAIEQTPPRQWYPASAIITLISVGRKYACSQGKLMGFTPISGAKKVLQSRTFRVTWGNIQPAPM